VPKDVNILAYLIHRYIFAEQIKNGFWATLIHFLS